MNLHPIAANQTELHLDNGTIVFFSYKTPVAACTADGFIRTNKFWSVTTSRHLNKCLDGRNYKEVDQEILEELV